MAQNRQYPFLWFFHLFFAAAAPTVHICLCMMVTAPIVASTALSLVPKAPASSVLCFALWVTNFQQLCRHGTLRKGTVGQSEFLQKVGMLSTLECCWAASWMYAEQNSGEHWLCTLPRKPVARTSPQDQSAGAVARTSCQMCSSGNIMPKANLLRAQSITKPQCHASFTREIDEDSLDKGRSAKLCWTSRFLLIPISFQSGCVWWCPDSLVEELVHDFNSLRVVRVWVKSVNEVQRTKFAQGFEYTKSARLFSSMETSRSAVLSHRSDCLLRTVVPVETDFFSERLCLVMSRLPCQRICPWLQQLESCMSVSKKCEWNPEDKVCARFWVHKKCKVVFKQRDFAFRSSFAWFRLLASDCCPHWHPFLFRAVLSGDVRLTCRIAWELYECE